MSLKDRSGLRVAFLTFIFLTMAALVEIGLRWEQQYGERSLVVESVNAELAYALRLNENQARQVSEINYTFYDRISEVYFVSFLNSNEFSSEMKAIMETRDITIMKLLDDHQKNVWRNLRADHFKKQKAESEKHKVENRLK